MKIESELNLRPQLMYPAGVVKRANWNMVIPAFSSMHSFLADNFGADLRRCSVHNI
jgi:hypothetical protein